MSSVLQSGPLFDGRALRLTSVMSDEIAEVVAQKAFEEVGAALGAVLKNPTGYYESRITVDRQRSDMFVVHDQGVFYGPWLAGVSSLNATSRFKGYAHWMRAKQRTEANVAGIAAPVVTKRIRQMT